MNNELRRRTFDQWIMSDEQWMMNNAKDQWSMKNERWKNEER